MMMTRVGSAKPVDDNYWAERLKEGQSYRQAASNLITLANTGENMNPAISAMVTAAIAYCDAVTAKKLNTVNQQDHAAAPKLLRSALGNALPKAQETRFKRLLGYKDAVQYGIKPSGLAQAQVLLAELEEFADWVEGLL